MRYVLFLLGRRCSVFITIVAFTLSSAWARAQLYGWTINEIYSNGNGSVQFIELSTQSAPGGLLLGGYQFGTSNPGDTASHYFATPVSQPSGGGTQFLLFATADFSLLPGAITPNYTIPNGFLFTPGGTLDVEQINGTFPSSISYRALPTDGSYALNAHGDIVPAIAENFAGQTFAIPEPSTLSLVFVGLGCGFLRFKKLQTL